MNSKLVQINLHGVLGERVGKKYTLDISSVGEAIHAINCLTNFKLQATILEKEKENLRYQVIVNDEAVIIDEDQQKEIIRSQQICELNLPRNDIRTIDIVPIIEGGDQGIVTAILGGLLIAVGIIVSFASFGLGAGLVVAGIGLLAAGIIYMLSEPPDFEDFRSGKKKYLFEGPDNITGEGGPIPILYGRLIVGSQVISAHLDTDYATRANKEDDYLVVQEFSDSKGELSVPILNEKGQPYPSTRVYSPNQKAIVYDLVSEGVIDGPVNVEYQYKGTAGAVGFDSYTPINYRTNNDLSSWLRSVYYNEVPILSNGGLSNFQQVTVSYSNGQADGQLLGNENNISDPKNQLRITRQLNERLYYTDKNTTDNIKIYRFFNNQIKTLRVTFKFAALYHGTKDQDPPFEPSKDVVHIYYRPIFNTDGDSYDRINSTSNSPPPINDTQFQFRNVNFTGIVRGGSLAWTTNIDLDNDPDSLSRLLVGWEVKIIRPNDFKQGVRDQAVLYLDSITEVYNDVYSMPNSAVFRNEFSSDYFASIPKRSYDLRGIKVKVPNNYNPISKTYSAQITHSEDDSVQEWNGVFAEEKVWTDNPAWCFYDLVTNRRYGLGRWITEDQIDKWTLYLVSKYCDTMVPDGYGSVEPRFACNLYIIGREQAYKVLNDFTSIFNAIVYYGFGFIQVVQDRLKDPVLQFNNSNVEDGNFIYSSSSKKARHTIALIRYSDPKNFFRPTTEYVEDTTNIQKYGYREIDLTAYGCTSRGQSVRLGRWALLSEGLETETVSFVAGLEGSYLRPGDVFKVYDRNKKTSNLYGRVTSISNSNTSITLDKEISLSNKDYKFSLITPSYFYDPSRVAGVPFTGPKDASGIRNPQLQAVLFNGSSIVNSDGKSTITLSSALNNTNYNLGTPLTAGVLKSDLTWIIESVSPTTSIDELQQVSDSALDYYRCIRIEEKGELKYEVMGLQYNSGKFALIENGLSFERTFFEYGTLPNNPIGFTSSVNSASSRYKVSYSFVIPDISGVTDFWVYANNIPFTGTGIPDSDYLIDILPLNKRQGFFFPTSTGNYHIRVYSYNQDGRILSSSFASGTAEVDSVVKPIESISVSTLMVDSYTGSYGSEVNIIESYDVNPTFTWQLGTAGASSDLEGVYSRMTLRYPSSGLIPHSQIIYEATGIPNSGKYEYTVDFNLNKSLYGGPYRNYSVVIEAHSDTDPSFTSAGNIFRPNRDEFQWVSHPWGYKHLLFMNPPITGITLTSGGFITGNYISTGYITPNGDISVKFTSGNLPSGIVGGFCYFATGVPFSANFAKTGNTIQRTEFDFTYSNHISKSVLIPYVVDDFKIQSGIYCLSFYDQFDREYKKFNPYFYTGLDVTNVVPITRTAGINDLFITSQIGFSDFVRKENSSNIKIIGSGTNYDFVNISADGTIFIINSYTGT